MNRDDFLDILKDYLEKYFNKSELDDILRDYEEYFLNAQLEGKSDEDIVNVLGSPKSVAKELINEIKFNSTNDEKNYGKEMDIIILKNIKMYLSKGKEKTTSIIKRMKDKLSADKIINGHMSSILVKVLIAIGYLALFIGVLLSILVLCCTLGFLIVGVIGEVPIFITGFSLLSINSSLGILIIFIGIFILGVLILLSSLFFNLVKLMRKIIFNYVNWSKTKLMYVKVRKKYIDESVKEKEEIIHEEE